MSGKSSDEAGSAMMADDDDDVATEVIDTEKGRLGQKEEDGVEEEDDIGNDHHGEDDEEEEDDTDPSQMVEVNHEGNERDLKEDEGEQEQTAKIKQEPDMFHEEQHLPNDNENPPSTRGGLLEQALIVGARKVEEAVNQQDIPEDHHNPFVRHIENPLLVSSAQSLTSMRRPGTSNSTAKRLMHGAGDDETIERRSLSQIINSKPRDSCPICGDTANGIHYGIYTCEGCKNFFKRSVVAFSLGKPYICKGNNNCNVSLFEDDGTTRRRTRCQYCRYQACLDAGMVHAGRSGRHIYASIPKQHQQQTQVQSNPSKFENNCFEDQLVDNDSEEGGSSTHYELSNGDWNDGQLQIEQLKMEQMQCDVEFLQSRIRELESSLAEKHRQLSIQGQQITSLKKQCEIYEQMRSSNSEHTSYLQRNGDASSRSSSQNSTVATTSANKLVAQFGNGSVTITSIGRRAPKRKSSAT